VTAGGWAFLVSAWLLVGGLVAYCFARLLADGRRGAGRAGGRPGRF
jgi:hypothetical protein